MAADASPEFGGTLPSGPPSSAPYSLAQAHPSLSTYDASFFAASTSSTPPVPSYAPYHSSHSAAAASFSPYPPTPYSMSLAPPTYAYSSNHGQASRSNAPATFPGVGHIRCYWTILTPQLDYVYLDPILQLHLGEFSNAFIGTNVLKWVHPDEREQLAEDLLPKEDGGAGIVGTGVFGSVTRCRYSRLISILRQLGCQQPPSPPDAEAYAIDADYLNLDITTSWIAGDCKGKGKAGQHGAVLAFFHVTADKDPVHDNDSEHRTEWSNWCGVSPDYPSYLTSEQCFELVAALQRVAGPSAPSSSGGPSTSAGDDKSALHAVLNGNFLDDGPPAHVFQILDTDGHAIVTFPESGGGPDAGKAYDVEQFSALAREVKARPREAVQSQTSCTRRYRSKHPVMRNGTLTTVESVVIMYGAITFACFQTGGVYLSTARKAGLSVVTNDVPTDVKPSFALEDVPITPTVGSGYLGGGGKRNAHGDGPSDDESPPSKRFKQVPLQPPVLPKLETSAPSPHGGPAASPRTAAPLNGLSISTNGRMFRSTLDVDSSTAGGISPTVASASAILGSLGEAQPSAPPGGDPGQQHRGGYAAFYNAHDRNGQMQQHAPFYPGTHSPYGAAHALPHPLSQSHSGYFPAAPHSPHEPAGHHAMFPPTSQPFEPHHHHHPQQQQQQHQQQGHFGQQVSPGVPFPPQQLQADGAAAQGGSSAAAGGSGPANGKKSPATRKPPKQRPDGPVNKPNQKACESCGTVNSPEWRKGPTGVKTLCNACGLRYARAVARQKKLAEQAANGGVVTKKGKKKGMTAAQKAASQAAAVDETAESRGTSSLPPGSQPPTTHSPLTSAAYDLSAFTHAPHSAPKPYTPYYSTAPQLASPYSHAPSPTMTHTPQYPSPGVSSAPSYFHPGMPLPTHAPLPPLAHAAGSTYDYARGMPQHQFSQPHSAHSHQPMHSPHLEQQQQPGGAGPSSAGMFAPLSGGEHPHAHAQPSREQQQQNWSPHEAPYGGQFGWPGAHSAEQRGPSGLAQHGAGGSGEERQR